MFPRKTPVSLSFTANGWIRKLASMLAYLESIPCLVAVLKAFRSVPGAATLPSTKSPGLFELEFNELE
jgi:hypothetical protein